MGKTKEIKEVRSIQYEVTQEMADTMMEVSDLGANISCLIIPSLKFLGNYILDTFNGEDLSGWYSSHEAVIEKLEKISYDIEIKPREIAWAMKEAIEAVHGEVKKKDAPWNRNTVKLIDQMGDLFVKMRELSDMVKWRIDAERKAEIEAGQDKAA